MAKDGTGRGGARPGAGRPRKPLAEKIREGQTSHRKTEIMAFDAPIQDLTGAEMPPVKHFLDEEQKAGIELEAKQLYIETWDWISARGCAHLINPFLVQQYAMAAARWIQCERAVSQFGFLARHPTTSQAIRSPYVSMAADYMAQSNRLWAEIFGVIRANSMTEYTGNTPQDDLMERLLNKKGGS